MAPSGRSAFPAECERGPIEGEFELNPDPPFSGGWGGAGAWWRRRMSEAGARGAGPGLDALFEAAEFDLEAGQIPAVGAFKIAFGAGMVRGAGEEPCGVALAGGHLFLEPIRSAAKPVRVGGGGGGGRVVRSGEFEEREDGFQAEKVAVVVSFLGFEPAGAQEGIGGGMSVGVQAAGEFAVGGLEPAVAVRGFGGVGGFTLAAELGEGAAEFIVKGVFFRVGASGATVIGAMAARIRGGAFFEPRGSGVRFRQAAPRGGVGEVVLEGDGIDAVDEVLALLDEGAGFADMGQERFEASVHPAVVGGQIGLVERAQAGVQGADAFAQRVVGGRGRGLGAGGAAGGGVSCVGHEDCDRVELAGSGAGETTRTGRKLNPNCRGPDGRLP